MKAPKMNYLGIIMSLVTLMSLFLPWWSIRANGVSIDVYPYGVRAWSVPTYDTDWVVDRLLTLDSALFTVGLLVVVSSILTVAGSLKLPPLLITPAALNFAAAFLFYRLMRSSISRLAHGYFSGTNLIPEGAWGFAIGIGVCVLAGLASPTPLILSYWKRRRQPEKANNAC